MRTSLPFTKMQAAANDFILFDGSHLASVDRRGLAVKVCNRAFGIGSDGLIVFEHAGDDPIKIDFYNPDGTSDVCGNGMRCLAGLMVRRKVRASNSMFLLESAGKPIEVSACHDLMRAQVLLPPPTFEPSLVPTTAQEALIDFAMEIAGQSYKITAINTGSTHCVIVVDDLSKAQFDQVGRALETHPLFPERTSVDFVEVINRDSVNARVWERAIGETPACGTGACAIALSCHRLGLTQSTIRVDFPGGSLEVEITRSGQPLLRGDFAVVFEGEFQSI